MKRKPVARKVGPESSRKAAASIKSINTKAVYRCLKRIQPATCEQVILELIESMPPGKKLREDPISGMFNLLHLEGRIVTTGKKGKNTSTRDAMLWRVSTPEERSFLKAFVGPASKAPWPSPDTLIELEEVKEVLETIQVKQVRRLYRRYKKGRLFKTLLRDKGIKWFMRNYDERGRKKDT